MLGMLNGTALRLLWVPGVSASPRRLLFSSGGIRQGRSAHSHWPQVSRKAVSVATPVCPTGTRQHGTEALSAGELQRSQVHPMSSPARLPQPSGTTAKQQSTVGPDPSHLCPAFNPVSQPHTHCRISSPSPTSAQTDPSLLPCVPFLHPRSLPGCPAPFLGLLSNTASPPPADAPRGRAAGVLEEPPREPPEQETVLRTPPRDHRS